MLAEFGTRLAPEVEVKVVDSTADCRYLVLPLRPAGTEGWPEAKLASAGRPRCDDRRGAGACPTGMSPRGGSSGRWLWYFLAALGAFVLAALLSQLLPGTLQSERDYQRLVFLVALLALVGGGGLARFARQPGPALRRSVLQLAIWIGTRTLSLCVRHQTFLPSGSIPRLPINCTLFLKSFMTVIFNVKLVFVKI